MNGFRLSSTLEDERILIRPLSIEDFDELYKCAADKMIWQGHPAKNRYKKAEFTAWFEDAIACQSTVIFEDKQTNELMGASRYYVEENSTQDISIGYTFLARKYWGGATNAAIKKLMLHHAFKYFDQVWFHIAPSNIRSQRAIEKVGAVYSHQGISHLSGQAEPWLFYKISKHQNT